jgi:hypothetical protein
MNKTMINHLSDSDEQVAGLDKEYRTVFDFLYSAFQGHPFVLPQTKRPSRPAYDALMVAGSITGIANLGSRQAKIRSNFISAATDGEQYEILVGRGNTVDAIKERVNLALKILTE